MRSVLGIFIALLGLSGCAHQDAWTTRDTVLQSTLMIVMAYDAYLTTQLQDCPRAREVGDIAKHVLGRQPATSDTYQYFAALIITDYLIARALPERWRPYWHGYGIGVHTYAVRSHHIKGECT